METGWRVHNGGQGYVGAHGIPIQGQPRRIGAQKGYDGFGIVMSACTHARHRESS